MSLLNIRNQETGKWESIPAFQGPEGPAGPPGSGDGGGEEVYELIDAVTIAEDDTAAHHGFTEEPDGTPYSFKKLMVKVSTEAATTVNFSWRQWSSVAYIGVGAESRTTVLLLECFKLKNASLPGTLRAEIVSYTTATAGISGGNVRGYGSPFYPFSEWDQSDVIDNIWLTGALPAGTKIEIYGVRA